MNPETPSTRAKITQTSVVPLVQATLDGLLGKQDQPNSGDVVLRRSSGSAIATDYQDSRRTFSGRARHAANPSGDAGAFGSWAA